MDGKKKKTEIGKLASVPLREAWEREADDFTPWLYDNLDTLAAELDLSGLEPEELEKRVGSFSADIVARDNEGRRVVIENQLEKTDHSHLGQLLTYVANLEDTLGDTKVAIWISRDPRPEHKRAVEWLDESVSDVEFYLVRVETWKIDDSLPAPKFTVVVRPTDNARKVGNVRREAATAHYESCRQFWQELLPKVNEKTGLFKSRNASTRPYLIAGAGRQDISFRFTTMENSSGVRFHIGGKSKEQNQAVFEKLKDHRTDIDEKFGEPLEWEEPERHRYRQISYVFKHLGRDAEGEDREQLLNDMAEKMSKLENTLKEYIKKLPR